MNINTILILIVFMLSYLCLPKLFKEFGESHKHYVRAIALTILLIGALASNCSLITDLPILKGYIKGTSTYESAVILMAFFKVCDEWKKVKESYQEANMIGKKKIDDRKHMRTDQPLKNKRRGAFLFRKR